jgi:hypothetical protein
LVAFAGSWFRLVLAADGTLLTPATDVAALASGCVGEIRAVDLRADDSLSLSFNGCEAVRKAPTLRNEMSQAALSVGVLSSRIIEALSN